MPTFERIDSQLKYDGQVWTVHEERYRHADGHVVTRGVVRHTGAVGIVVHDGEHLWLVRQPREIVGTDDLLELPAGRLDQEGESPLQTAKRELAEEIGKAAEHWEPLTSYLASVGVTDECVHLFLATGLSDVEAPDSGEDERIEIVCWPLDNLDRLVGELEDAKTLIGVLLLQARLRDGV